MKLFLLSQDVNRGYDTYDAIVVAALTEAEARLITPRLGSFTSNLDAWAEKPEQVEVDYLGEAKEGTESGVILESFNAG